MLENVGVTNINIVTVIIKEDFDTALTKIDSDSPEDMYDQEYQKMINPTFCWNRSAGGDDRHDGSNMQRVDIAPGGVYDLEIDVFGRIGWSVVSAACFFDNAVELKLFIHSKGFTVEVEYGYKHDNEDAENASVQTLHVRQLCHSFMVTVESILEIFNVDILLFQGNQNLDIDSLALGLFEEIASRDQAVHSKSRDSIEVGLLVF